jgi:hypothetical protein
MNPPKKTMEEETKKRKAPKREKREKVESNVSSCAKLRRRLQTPHT